MLFFFIFFSFFDLPTLKKFLWQIIATGTLPLRGFLTFYRLQKEKVDLSLPHPSMQCCVAVRVTCRKQLKPQL